MSCRCGTHTPVSVSVLSIWTPAGCGLALSRFSQSFISTSGLPWLPPPLSLLPSCIDLPLIYMEVGAAQTIPPTRPPHLRILSESIKMQFSTLEAFIVLLPQCGRTDGLGTPSLLDFCLAIYHAQLRGCLINVPCKPIVGREGVLRVPGLPWRAIGEVFWHGQHEGTVIFATACVCGTQITNFGFGFYVNFPRKRGG